MAARLLQHPGHDHPLEHLNLRSIHDSTSIPTNCKLCRRKISSDADAYACLECQSHYYHRVCAEAPPRIDLHPLHPVHPLTLVHGLQSSFACYACCEFSHSGSSFYRCETCYFDVDISCALSTLSDHGGSQGLVGVKTQKLISLPLHPHPLALFSNRHDFVDGADCAICLTSVEGEVEGYMCLRRWCKFLIHERCIRDLYYPDGTKAPRVYHDHPLTTFVTEDAGTSRCADCRSDAPGKFIGCRRCGWFIHGNCIQGPESLQYPPHRGHTLVLFLNRPDHGKERCQSCSGFMEGELCYHCTSCELVIHVECAHRVLDYCKKGMSAEIELPWHGHPLFLCHRIRSVTDSCSHCNEKLIGPAYACKVNDCQFLLHKECAESMFEINHPFHSDHPLTLLREVDGTPSLCVSCCEIIIGFSFSCELCAFYLHVKCSSRIPTLKHCLHEHELLLLDEAPSLKCYRCGINTNSPLFRCVLCNFNLHKECMELPQVMKSKMHWHPLTLHETFLEDDSGEYYCDRCAKWRDPRLGAYVCGECKLTLPPIYHIECVLPEFQKVSTKKNQRSTAAHLADRLVRKKKMVRAHEGELVKMKQELDEMKQELDEMAEKIVAKNEEVRLTEESMEKKKQEVYDLVEQISKRFLEEENELGKLRNAED